MKNSKFLLGLAAGVFFAGCATDDMSGGQGAEVVGDDEVRYINVALCTSGAATRAVFDEGSEAENAVQSVRFYFYDIDGNPTAASVEANNLTFSELDTDNTQSVAKTAVQTLEVALKKGDKLPAYIVCLMNSVADASYDHYNMNELRLTETSDLILAIGDKSYFKMNNSVYYGKDEVAGKAKTRIFGTPIFPDELAATPEDAEEIPAVDIYVERYAAKVTFKLDERNVADHEGVNGYKLTFVPAAWGINADAATSYVAKRFFMQTGDNAGKAVYVPTFDEISAELGSWGDAWNDEPNRRSYWACSPSYYGTSFPQVADDITDKDGGHAGETVGDYLLRYYSFAQLTDLQNAASKVSGKTVGQAVDPQGSDLYVFENTASAAAFASANPKAAVPSVVIAGHYAVAVADDAPEGTPALNEKETFYLYGKLNNNWNLYRENAIMDAFLSNQLVLAENTQEGSYLRSGHDGLLIGHPSKAARELAGVKVPSRYVTLQIDETNVPDGLYYLDGTSWVAVDATNAVVVNVRLLQTLGYAQKYSNGACYFSVPVKHLRFQESGNPNKDMAVTSPDFKWSEVRVGDFGLVRNHAYAINVTGISGLATAVSDPDAPIVPPLDEDEYYVSYQINILKWAVVPQQDIEL